MGSPGKGRTRDAATPSTQSNDLLTFADVYRQELWAIGGWHLPERPAGGNDGVDGDAATREQAYQRALFREVSDRNVDLSALCLSGGGIRSASFALGVLQGLARYGLLARFDYLSSVSGGGYIASWLSAWRHFAPDSEVFAALNQSLSTGNEAPQITGIRADSNYLTPRLGLLSGDTWTLLTLYLRNLVLNWLLFVPFFMGCFMVPRLWWAIVGDMDGRASGFGLWLAYVTGGAFLLAGVTIGVYGRFRRDGRWLTNLHFKLTSLAPLLLSGLCLTLAAVLAGQAGGGGLAHAGAPWSPGLGSEALVCRVPRISSHCPWVYGAIPGAGIYFLAWAIGRFLSLPYAKAYGERIEPLDVFFWTVSGAVVGLILHIGMSLVANHAADSASAPFIATLGLSGFVLAYLIGELIYVGLASFSGKGDMDREWLARSSGWLSATVVGLTLVFAVAIFAPSLLREGWQKAVGLAAGGIAGVVTLTLGSSGRTAATQALQALENVPLGRLASTAAVIFALAAASVLSSLDESLELMFAGVGASAAQLVALRFELLLSLIGAAFVLSSVVNVNTFSLHALYRNRLVRAFLGSSRGASRRPDPFTGFDPNDNIELAQSSPREPQKALFHVINAALNVCATKNAAWQERKAESFTMSRLACGNAYVGYRPTRFYGDRRGGLSLGTALAISGAAVSPNQGYNSSPLIGFLLMLFNIRLGWWLGNPRRADSSRDAGPTWSLTPALRELAGDTSDSARWIYLSDGGHFENLGLYEMVRRRCRVIVISDAGCDPACSFQDLGNAVRKIYIDFGISIEFTKLDIKPRQNPPVPGLRFAIGTITYPESARPGWLLYIKPTFFGTTERVDVRSYASGNPTFPHESTTDQWFSESQFESYRALGASITEFVCGGGKALAPGESPAVIDFARLKVLAQSLLDSELDGLGSGSSRSQGERSSPGGARPETERA